MVVNIFFVDDYLLIFDVFFSYLLVGYRFHLIFRSFTCNIFYIIIFYKFFDGIVFFHGLIHFFLQLAVA